MRQRKYSAGERERAVREVVDSSRPSAAVARDRSISPSTLRRWVREAEGKQWAEQVERHFGFLARYGFAVTGIDASTWWEVRVTYRSPHSAIAVIRSVEFERVEVQLMRLVDGELPEYPIFVVDSVPVNTFYAADLFGLRLAGADEVLASQHGLEPEQVEAQVAFWSQVLRDHGGDLLAGDLSVLDELEQRVRDRAGQHRQEVVIWFPEDASADEEAHAVDDTRTTVPEGVAVVARRYRQAPRAGS
jgi:transposase-like protein